MLKIKTGSENKERERILCCHHLFLTLISKMCFCDQRNEQIRVAMMFTSKSNRLVGFKSSIMTSFTVGFLMRYIQNCIAMRLFYSLRSMRIYAVRLIFPLFLIYYTSENNKHFYSFFIHLFSFHKQKESLRLSSSSYFRRK